MLSAHILTLIPRFPTVHSFARPIARMGAHMLFHAVTVRVFLVLTYSFQSFPSAPDRSRLQPPYAVAAPTTSSSLAIGNRAAASAPPRSNLGLASRPRPRRQSPLPLPLRALSDPQCPPVRLVPITLPGPSVPRRAAASPPLSSRHRSGWCRSTSFAASARRAPARSGSCAPGDRASDSAEGVVRRRSIGSDAFIRPSALCPTCVGAAGETPTPRLCPKTPPVLPSTGACPTRDRHRRTGGTRSV